MEKIVVYGLIATMTFTAAVVTFEANVVTEVLWTLSQYIGEVVAIVFIWLMFPSKLVRGLLVPCGVYYLTECVMGCMYFIDIEAYTLINTKYTYLLTVGVGFSSTLSFLIHTHTNDRMVKKEPVGAVIKRRSNDYVCLNGVHMEQS